MGSSAGQTQVHDTLGNFGQGNLKFEIAGLIDRQANKIAISRRFEPRVMRFTGAHELGHWQLHPHDDGASRASYTRPPQEVEADYFAACFLIPRNLLRRTIEDTFGIEVPISFSEHMAYWLAPDDPNRLVYPDDGSRVREFAMASCTRFAGTHIHSLAEQFDVSTTAMAIQIAEFGLINKYP